MFDEFLSDLENNVSSYADINEELFTFLTLQYQYIFRYDSEENVQITRFELLNEHDTKIYKFDKRLNVDAKVAMGLIDKLT